MQNLAFDHVSPAFYAMMASTLPVGVTVLSIVRGLEPFRLTTLAAAALVGHYFGCFTNVRQPQGASHGEH